jgi:hypothetical protein
MLASSRPKLSQTTMFCFATGKDLFARGPRCDDDVMMLICNCLSAIVSLTTKHGNMDKNKTYIHTSRCGGMTSSKGTQCENCLKDLRFEHLEAAKKSGKAARVRKPTSTSGNFSRTPSNDSSSGAKAFSRTPSNERSSEAKVFSRTQSAETATTRSSGSASFSRTQSCESSASRNAHTHGHFSRCASAESKQSASECALFTRAASDQSAASSSRASSVVSTPWETPPLQQRKLRQLSAFSEVPPRCNAPAVTSSAVYSVDCANSEQTAKFSDWILTQAPIGPQMATQAPHTPNVPRRFLSQLT